MMGLEFTRRQWLTIVVISIADFCNAICVSLQAPFYPKEAELKGCKATEYGLVFGVFELVVFIVSPWYGKYLNRIGPKLLFNAGILTTGTSAIFFGLLDKVHDHIPFITMSFVIRIIEAMGNAAFLTASFAIIAKEFPNNVATMFASLETFFGLGLIVGPMVGGALYGAGGFFLPFGVLGSALFCAAVMSVFTLPVHHDDDDVQTTGTSMTKLLRIPDVALAALSIVSTSMSIVFLQATLEPHLRESDFNLIPVVLGLMFVINGGVYAVTAPAWGWLCDKPGVAPKAVIVMGCLFVAGGFLAIGPAPFFDTKPVMWVTVLGLVLHGLGMSCQLVASFTDALNAAISNGLPNTIETYGLVSGMWTSVFALGAFIGPTVSGVLYDKIGFRASTLFIFVLHTIVGLIIAAYLWCGGRRGLILSGSQGNLLQMDGTLDGSVLLGDEEYVPPAIVKRRRHRGVSIEQSRPPAMNSLIACSSYKNRGSPWGRTRRDYVASYGSLDTRHTRPTMSLA